MDRLQQKSPHRKLIFKPQLLRLKWRRLHLCRRWVLLPQQHLKVLVLEDQEFQRLRLKWLLHLPRRWVLLLRQHLKVLALEDQEFQMLL
jgi:hypothetical protein